MYMLRISLCIPILYIYIIIIICVCFCLTEEHIDENHESLAADTVKHFNVKLRYKLPLDDAMFFGMVKQAGLFPLDTGAYIETLNTRAQKVGYFLQYLVEPAASEYLPKLLKVMKNSKEPSLVKLAKEIQEHLAKEILVAERGMYKLYEGLKT